MSGEVMKVVEKFNHLFSTVTVDGNNEMEIRARLAIARAVVGQLTEVWKGKVIGRSLKVQP